MTLFRANPVDRHHMEHSLARSLRSLLAAAALLLGAYGIAATPASAAGPGASTTPAWQLASLREPLARVQDRLGLHAVRQPTAILYASHARPSVPAPSHSLLVWVVAGLCFAVGIAWRRWPSA